MAGETDLLSQLRDLHVPPPPPAESGLLTALSIAVATLILISALIAWYTRKPAWKRQALDELSAIENLPPAQAVFRAAKLVRQIAAKADPDAGSMETGDRWLARLDERFATDFFTNGAGRAMGQDLYRANTGTNGERDALISGLRPLIKHTRWSAR